MAALDPDARKSSFPPVVDAATRVLVLGSLPGEESLRRGQYYGNPRNQFWTLVGAVLGVDLEGLAYEPRVATLQAGGVGLWDVVRTARRAGSLDGAIRDHQPNALAELAASLPELRAIAFNGGKAAAIGRRVLTVDDWALVDLPSSSPAYTMSFDAKLARWRALAPFLARIAAAPAAGD
ncbi:MAG TPA: DNA-deoxyinosine glycosylase [Caulobacteraceae bacterium]|nr:DNA-deoxyinosine glycosylase [Caulobacteraceae bacterium]